MDETTNIIDLDALVPKPAILRFQGKEISVSPPKISDVLKLTSLGQRMEGFEQLDPAAATALVADINTLVQQLIPELGGEELNTMQLLTVMKAISEMSVPPDAKELEKRGISAADPKAPSAGDTSLPSSSTSTADTPSLPA